MYWKYSLGFLIASLTQAAIIAVTEALGISTLGAKITFGQLIIHILAGQAVGFLLMVIMQGITGIAKTNFWLLGSIYGAIVWVALVSINSAQGTINAPWTAAYINTMGDPIADLHEDMAAEQKARATYENLINLTDDPDLADGLKFLREREVVHFQRFGETLNHLQGYMNGKKFY
jgi:hypothetical protein